MHKVSGLTIRLFGAFEAAVDGVLLPRSRQNDRLLTLLVLRHGQAAERAWLAATLWPDADEQNALFYLRRTLTELRRALGPEATRLLSPTARTLQLDLANADCDLLAFDAALARGDDASLTEAVRLYRGPLLEGWYEEWAQQDREGREHAYLDAAEAVARDALARQAPQEALVYLRRVISVEPLRETAQRTLMQALAAMGDYAAVTQVYRDFRLLLHEELNTAPAAETTALYHRLREEGRKESETPKSISPHLKSEHRTHHLPNPISSLIGREEAVQEIVGLLSTTRLVTLTGTGGVGKTRLAIAVAQWMEEEYSDRSWFADLSPLTDPELVPQAVATALEVRAEPGRSLIEVLQAFLAGKELLLILDNCEHLEPACAALANALLSACPGLRIIATSRQALGLIGERRWRVPSLTLPDLSVLTQAGKESEAYLMESSAAQLFVERATAIYSPFRVTAQNVRGIGEVCCLLEGIPFAIELASAWTRIVPVGEIVTRLEDQLNLLVDGGRVAPTRQQTLRATLDWSYGLLEETEQRLLCRLSVFAGGWTLEAAEQVCGEKGDQANAVLRRLARLADHSMVVFEERGGKARYRLLATTRQYAREKLREREEERQIQERHGAFFLALAEEVERNMRGPEQDVLLARLEQEHDNLRTVLDFCKVAGGRRQVEPEEISPAAFTPHPAEMGLRLAGALLPFWQVRGYWEEGRTWYETILSRVEAQEPTQARGKSLLGAGALADLQGDYDSARALFLESLPLWEALEDKRGIAIALNSLGTVAWHQGDYDSARTFYESSLAMKREEGDLRGIANALNNLGLVAWNQRDYDSARAFYEESLAIRKELGDKVGLATSFHNLGTLTADQSDHDSARTFYEESLALKRELGNTAGIALTLHNLGNSACAQGDYIAARAHYMDSLVRWKKLEDKKGVAHSLEAFARLAAALGQMERTIRLRSASEALHDSLGARRSPNDQEEHDRDLAAARVALGESAFLALWAEGRAWTTEQAIEYAMQDNDVGKATPSTAL